MQSRKVQSNFSVVQKLALSPALVLLLLCSWSITCKAQEAAFPNRGFHPGNSYSLGEIETLNTSSGNLMLRVPLGSLPAGRGGSKGFALQLLYNSKLWDSYPDKFPHPSRPGEEVPVNRLEDSPEGGWRYNIGSYSPFLYNRTSHYGESRPANDPYAQYVWKLKMRFPDGSVRELLPQGSQENGGWYSVTPHPGMTYYSTDGSFLRLQYDGADNTTWTLYFPDGTRVVNVTGQPQRTYDRNNNYTEIQDTTYNGHPAAKIVDQLGRAIFIEKDSALNEDYIHVAGFNNQPLTWTVKWKTIKVYKSYEAGRGTMYPETIGGLPFEVVDQVILPAQAGSLAYTFGYNTDATTNPSVGWGEVNSVTLPSGATAAYQYVLDGYSGSLVNAEMVLNNHPKRKDLTYLAEYDGTSTPVTESWTYEPSAPTALMNVKGITSTTGPDGGVTTETFGTSGYLDRLSLKTVRPDGSVSERIWQENIPYGTPDMTAGINTYVKTEFTSITNAAGTLVKTAIKDYSYDKNGNVTRVAEYDWVDYSSIPRDSTTGRPTGLPAGVTPKRVTLNTYYNPTADASSTAEVPGVYHYNGTRKIINLIKSSQVKDGASQTKAWTEYVYDNADMTGNLIKQSSWDSVLSSGAVPSAADLNGLYLNAINSVSVSHQYDVYGNLTLTTDAKGYKTQMVYGAVGSYTDLYPTQIIVALGTTVRLDTTKVYDFYSGLVMSITDVDNDVTTVTDYDDLGRPVEVRSANNVAALKRVTRTEYSDAERRVIVRSDLNTAYDGQFVGVQHYDQLGRVRLSRQLEDPTLSADDETTGIKVQTRYTYSGSNSYQMVSNPYRAATSSTANTETTMGWTRTTADNAGRVVEVRSYTGSSLPAPLGTNASTTGAMTTTYDAESITVRDQMGRDRQTTTDALGRLSQVVEDPGGLGYLTVYTYDALSNLTKVTQDTQTSRTFTYSSLSRLTSAFNPESGTVNYEYDKNGNMTKKTDARAVSTTYSYDALNRLTLKNYSDTTPDVKYSYDSQALSGEPVFAKGASQGRLVSVTIGGTSAGSYYGYDELGQVVTSLQRTDAQTYGMSYGYDLAGNMTSQTYPSGRVVSNTYDAAGRLSRITGQEPGQAEKTYASSINYSAHGGVKGMQLGNSLWEHTNFNARLQPTEIGLGTTQNGVERLKLSYGYGTTDNNGNVRSQTITVPNITIAGTTVAGHTAKQDYTYDALNRLETAKETVGTTTTQAWRQVYAYDRFGNRNFGTGTTLPALPSDLVDIVNNPQLDPLTNRIKENQNADPAKEYQYDAAGNLKCDPLRPCAPTTNAPYYEYDAENRMVKNGGGADPNDASAATYSYDGEGRRVKKASGTTATVYVYDAVGQLVAEYGAPTSGAGTSYLTQDHLGSTRLVTGQDGMPKSRHDYLPFGEEIQLTDVPDSGRAANQGYNSGNIRQKFTQKERDSETGLDYFGARYYASAQGRFTSPDDFLNDTHADDPASWNLYVYVRNNPLKYVDPFGEDIYGTNLDTKERQKLIDDWKKKTGYVDIQFDQNGQLQINVAAGRNGGSDKLANQLLDAATSTINRFNLESVDTNKVAFASVDGGRNILNTNNQVIRREYKVSIDFGDFDRIGSSDKEAKEAFSVGIVAIHEFDHRVYGITDFPNGPSDPGPLENTYINPGRREIGLAERVHYASERVPSYLRNAFPNGGQQIRFKYKGKDKVLRWREDLVGGVVK